MPVNNRKVHTALFLSYCALMLWLLFDRPGYNPGLPYWEQTSGHLNLIPFRTLRKYPGQQKSQRNEHDDIAAQIDHRRADMFRLGRMQKPRKQTQRPERDQIQMA